MAEDTKPEIMTDEMITQYRMNRPVDSKLNFLLDAAFGENDENQNSRLSFFLAVKGTEIIGTAVPLKVWREQMITKLEQQPGADALAKTLRRFDAKVEELQAETKEEDEQREERLYPDSRRWINLVDVHILSGNHTRKLPQLRVDIDSVDAWSLIYPEDI